MTQILARIHAWVTEAPWIALVMLVGAAVIFCWAMRRDEIQVGGWVGRWMKALGVIVRGLVLPLLFLVILWAVRVVLARTEYDFRRQHGRLSEVNKKAVQSIWGKQHVQRDLVVNHTYEVVVKEPMRNRFGEPLRDSSGRIIERERRETRTVDQNSIVQTRGEVLLTKNYRRKGSALYPCFELQCRFRYQAKNFADRKTNAHFVFPLSPEQTMFNKFTVRVNGEDESSRLHFDPIHASWTLPMQPGQICTVEVSYETRGMERFYYQVSDVREIRDFLLTIDLPGISREDVNYPEGCITPTRIEQMQGARGTRLVWKLDRALTTRGMGIALPDPPQPGEQVARVLRYAWRGGMLLLVTLTITGIAMGAGFDVLRAALIAGVFTGEFMFLAALTDHIPSFWIIWAVTAAGAVLLSATILGGRTIPKPMLALSIVFMAVYPLLCLPSEVNRSLLAGMDVLTVAYLAILGAITLRRQSAVDAHTTS